MEHRWREVERPRPGLSPTCSADRTDQPGLKDADQLPKGDGARPLMGTGHSCRSVRPAETDTVSCADLKTLRSATVGVDDVDAH